MAGNRKNGKDLSRRKFLGTAGLALGASTLTPVFPAIDSAIKFGNRLISGNTINIGVLLPASNIYPDMANNFYSGLNLFFSNEQDQLSGFTVNLKQESMTFGPSSVFKKSQKLINEDRVDILTGIIPESVSPDLRTLLEDSEKLMVANHTGANRIDQRDLSKQIVHNSLNLWQANYALGKWAAKNIGKRAMVVSSFYESGYDALYAFNLGFESEGGTIIDTKITNLPAEMDNTNNVIAEISKQATDLVFASFSGNEAQNFLSDYAGSDLNGQIPLLGSGFLVDGSKNTDIKPGIKTCLSWSPGLNNRKFQSEYKKMTGKNPDAFAVLGYESAALISQCVTKSDGRLNNQNMVQQILSHNQLSGPRGNLIFNKHTHVYESPLYLNEFRTNEQHLTDVIVSDFDNVKNNVVQFDELRSGWLNPYLCA